MDKLQEIIAFKRKEVERTCEYVSAEKMYFNSDLDLRKPLDFTKALQKKGLSLIAEIKKASPSKGLIRENFHPLEIAKSYVKHGASCLSILTEEKYFQGSPEYLIQIKEKFNIPLLRKDFIVNQRQIRESYDMGADAILLIAACLSKFELSSFYSIATEFGLACLFEVHSKEELALVLKLNPQLVGVNNRNLKTFKTDLKTSYELKKLIPAGITAISESGINSKKDCEMLHKNAYDAVLVGESLMREVDPGLAIQDLLGIGKS